MTMKRGKIVEMLNRSVHGRRTIYLILLHFSGFFLFVGVLAAVTEALQATTAAELANSLSYFQGELWIVSDSIAPEIGTHNIIAIPFLLVLWAIVSAVIGVLSLLIWPISFSVFYANAIVPQSVIVLFFEAVGMMIIFAALIHIAWATQYHVRVLLSQLERIDR